MVTLFRGDVKATALEQTNAIVALPAYSDPCDSDVKNLNLVELCDGTRLYLSDYEISLIPGLVKVLHRFYTDEFLGDDPNNTGPVGVLISVILNGQQDFLSLNGIYCDRFAGLTLIATEGCNIFEEEETTTCETTITSSNLRAEVDPDEFEVELIGDVIALQTCNNGSNNQVDGATRKSFKLRTNFKELFCVSSGNDKFQFNRIKLKEVLSGSVLNVRMSPANLEADFPGITNHIAGLGGDLSNVELTDLIITNGGEATPLWYPSLVDEVLKYAISAHSGQPISQVNFDLHMVFNRGLSDNCNNSGNGFYIELGTYIMHAPTKTSYIIEPCLNNVKVKVTVDGTPVVTALNPNVEITEADVKLKLLCGQSLSIGSLQSKSKNNAVATCIADEALSNCTDTLQAPYLGNDLVCEPMGIPGIPYDLVPTILAQSSFDLTQILNFDNAWEQTSTLTCAQTTTTQSLTCIDNDNPGICYDGDCNVDLCNPIDFGPDCSPEQLAARDQQLVDLNTVFQVANSDDLSYPTQLLAVSFCEGITRYLLPEEMTALNVTYRITRRIPIEDAATLLHIDTGTMSLGNLANFLKDRKSHLDITATLAPIYDNPAPDLDPVTGEPLNGNQPEVASPVTFYLFDHLGNTRVTFRADASDAISITYAADYYPYGKILREYNCQPNRYLSTHHERDVATGYDNRGARLYDAEIGRFLGVDPMAGKFKSWSSYNYVLGNPTDKTDPDGRMAKDCCGGDDPPSEAEVHFQLSKDFQSMVGEVASFFDHLFTSGNVKSETPIKDGATLVKKASFSAGFNLEQWVMEARPAEDGSVIFSDTEPIVAKLNFSVSVDKSLKVPMAEAAKMVITAESKSSIGVVGSPSYQQSKVSASPLKGPANKVLSFFGAVKQTVSTTKYSAGIQLTTPKIKVGKTKHSATFQIGVKHSVKN